MKKVIIAIDGPSASGKSTTAKLLAQKLGYVYLDTGAMYRACGLQAVREGIKANDEKAITSMMDRIKLEISYTASGNVVSLNGENVSEQIRTPEMSSMASAVSAIGSVRKKMVELQRKLGAEGGVVLDGRDIGTVVFPEAACKFFLVASIRERAKRRYLELHAKGIAVNLDDVAADLEARDKADSSRSLAPLKPAQDAILIDTSDLSIEQQVNELYALVMKKLETGC